MKVAVFDETDLLECLGRAAKSSNNTTRLLTSRLGIASTFAIRSLRFYFELEKRNHNSTSEAFLHDATFYQQAICDKLPANALSTITLLAPLTLLSRTLPSIILDLNP